MASAPVYRAIVAPLSFFYFFSLSLSLKGLELLAVFFTYMCGCNLIYTDWRIWMRMYMFTLTWGGEKRVDAFGSFKKKPQDPNDLIFHRLAWCIRGVTNNSWREILPRIFRRIFKNRGYLKPRWCSGELYFKQTADFLSRSSVGTTDCWFLQELTQEH